MCSELDKQCPLDIGSRQYECSHTKTIILLQAHFSHLKMPCSDYITDLKSVLDQSIRILQAMIDISAEGGYLVLCLRLVQLMQMVIQARWVTDPPITTLPEVEKHLIPSKELPALCLPHLCNLALKSFKQFEEIMLKTQLEHKEIEKVKHFNLFYLFTSVKHYFYSLGICDYHRNASSKCKFVYSRFLA